MIHFPTFRPFLYIFFILFSFSLKNSYSQNYLFPVKDFYGLSGTFGEMRTTHYHFGLDIRVQEKWGLPILAASDGYVSRVFMYYYGYGRAIYIKHKDGYTTCYAHLETFHPDVERKLRQIQKNNRQFNQDLFFAVNEFVIKKGDTIGYSGSTGASTGPHLHFEIRDPAERIVNPMKYLKPLIKDNIPPFITRIAFEPVSTNSRINGVYNKYTAYPMKYGNTYKSEEIVKIKGKVGFEFTGYDKLNGSPNYNGFYAAQLFLDSTLIYQYKMDRFAFHESRYIMQHTDYAFDVKWDGCLQKCYIDEGNFSPLYSNLKNKGFIELSDDQIHQLKLIIKDYHGSQATFIGRIKRDNQKDQIAYGTNSKLNRFNYKLHRKHLIIESPIPKSKEDKILITYSNRQEKSYDIDYTHSGIAYTIVKIEPTSKPTMIKAFNHELKLPPNQIYKRGSESNFSIPGKINAYFGNQCLFDQTLIEIKESPSTHPNACSEIFEVGSIYDPVFKPFAIRIIGTKNLDKFQPHQRMLIEYKQKGGFNRWSVNQNGASLAKRFGKYCLIGDNTPPKIQLLNFTNGQKVSAYLSKLTFKVSDDIAEVNPRKINFYLDGQWVVAEYYEYTQLMIHHFEKPLEKGEHHIKIEVEDNARNKTVKEFKFSI